MIIIPEDVLRIAEALSAPIDELGLSVRSYNGLRRWGITTVADVYRAYEDKQLPRIRNLGEKSVIEIEKHLEEHLAKVAPASSSEIPNSSDTISRANAIEALYSQREKAGNIWVRTAITNCVEAIEQLPPAQPKNGVIEQIKWERDVAIEQLKKLGYGLGEKIRAEKDCISRQAAIEAVNSLTYPSSLVDVKRKLADLQPAQLAPDQNGDLWINVPDIDKVTRIYVQESKSKFCRIFYEERI